VSLGVPPPIQSSSSLAAVAIMIEIADLPETFAAQVEIQRHMARYLAVLTTDQRYTFNVSAIKIFEVELDSISTRFKTVWNAEAECSLLTAKLSLFALACINCPEEKRGVFLHSTNWCTCVKYREMVILMFNKTSGHR
jgi:hypothetical protein